MNETLQSLLGHRPYGATFEFGHMFGDIRPAPHALIWDSSPYITAIRGTPKMDIRTLRFPVSNSAVPFVPVVCFWFHSERVYCAYVDFRSIEKRQKGVTAKFLDENTELKIVLVDREITNGRRLVLKNPLYELAKRAMKDLEGKEWFSNDFLEAKLRIQADFYEVQLWDMGVAVDVDLDTTFWDDSFTIEPKSPPLFKRYVEVVDSDSSKNDS